MTASVPASVLDAHVHLWDPDLLRYAWLDGSPLRRRVEASELATAADPVAEFVLVQADCAPEQALAEVTWLADQAERLPAVRGIVAYAPLHRGSAAAEHLARLQQVDLVVGVRRLIQDEPPGFTAESGFRTGVALLAESDLPFDLCIREHQLAETVDLVRETPQVQFILDHLGKPRVGADPAGWRHQLAALSRLPNVACKLSGLLTEVVAGRSDADTLGPYLTYALEVFGPHRCLYGSDWPVLTLAGSYPDWRDLVIDVVQEIAGGDRDAVLGDTARRLYQPRTERAHPLTGSAEKVVT